MTASRSGMVPLRVAPLAAERLAGTTGGHVVARFTRTVTLDLNAGAAGGAWVSLHPSGPVPSPFGIAGVGWPSARAGVATPVAVERRAGRVVALRLDGGRIVLDGATEADTRVPRGAPAPALEALLPRALAQVRDGLLPLGAALLGVPGAGASSSTPALAAALRAAARPALLGLARATAAAEPEACLVAAARLVGLGPGLTPAGDDALIGWVVGLHASGDPHDARLLDAVARPLANLAARGTTDLSRALLAAALAGHLSEPAAAFVRRPDGRHLAALLAQGATSGGDFLAGYGLARRARSGAGPVGGT